jgi:phage virion morphogenesis protein
VADEDLHRFEEWFGKIILALAPEQRRRAAAKLGQALRKANLRRIADNVNPDGSVMEGGKSRLDRRGRLRVRAGKRMFRGLKASRNWKLAADAEGLEISTASGLVERIASLSQFGETATVGRTWDGRRIRHRYAVRRLLGFSPDDEALVTDVAADLIERAAR